jgi:hypothetical protein
MAHDVFVCYSSEDKTIANAACAKLESAGIRCWMAPRDPIAGIPYGRQLVEAITATRVVLLIFSGNTNRSEHVLRELEVASDSGKIIVPFRIENVVPSGDLRYYITRVHWLDAMSPPMEARLNELVTLMQRLLDMPIAPAPPAPVRAAASPRSGYPLVAALLVIGITIALALALYFMKHSSPAAKIAKTASTAKPSQRKTIPIHTPAIVAQETPRVVYVAAPPQPQAPVARPSLAPVSVHVRARATPHAVSRATPAPAVKAVALAPQKSTPPQAADQSAPVPWHGPTAYPADWQVGTCTITSQTLSFFTIPSGPYAGMTRLVSRQNLSGTGCELRFSYALYSADHAYLGTLTENYNAIGLQRRAQNGSGTSNFEFDRSRFGSAAYVVRHAVPQ